MLTVTSTLDRLFFPRHVPVVRAVTRELCSDPRHLPPDARDPDPNPRGPVPFGAVAGEVDPRVVAPVIRLDIALGVVLAVPDELFVPGDSVHTGVHLFDRRLSGSGCECEKEGCREPQSCDAFHRLTSHPGRTAPETPGLGVIGSVSGGLKRCPPRRRQEQSGS